MRILICALDGPEPRTNGIRLAVAALLDELRNRHEIRYLGYRMPDQRRLADNEEMRLIEPQPPPVRGTSLLRATLRGRPWEADRLAAGLEDALVQEVKTFDPDVVHVTSPSLAGLGRIVAEVGSVLTAFDAWHLNVDAQLAVAGALRRPLLRAEARRVQRFQAEEFERFGRVVVVSEQDKAQLAELNPRLEISFIPNGVDADFFSTNSTPVVPRRIVFTGGMAYAPNIVAAEFLARELLPRVRAVHPDAHVVIVGRDPHPHVLRLGALDGVEVTGEVDDIRPWLRSAQVFACPMLSGTGIKNKLLEAMATGLPCVATPLGLQGLDVTVGHHVLCGESPDELAREILRVFASDDLGRRLGREAREYICAKHSWALVARAYEDVYRAVQESFRTRTVQHSA
jgi:glycosyltransferase involved in cell wall biosynthesis